jgi:hypothetical protein
MLDGRPDQDGIKLLDLAEATRPRARVTLRRTIRARELR